MITLTKRHIWTLKGGVHSTEHRPADRLNYKRTQDQMEVVGCNPNTAAENEEEAKCDSRLRKASQQPSPRM